LAETSNPLRASSGQRAGVACEITARSSKIFFA
jgi:hypothetical protein